MKRGIATFTLDYGTCPPWLFQRMVKLGRAMTEVLVSEFGPDEFVRRIADPVWFQSLGTVLAFDWNASGLTTILTAALKEAIRGEEKDLGIFICGGKGKTSKKTPDQIFEWGEELAFDTKITETLIDNSKMSAKVDSSLVQDNYQLYHHAFFFSENGAWTVVQQGMNQQNRTARRYHWHDMLNIKNQNSEIKNETVSFVNEPHTAISSQLLQDRMLNLVAKDSEGTRSLSTDLVRQGYSALMKDIQILRKHSSKLSRTITLKDGSEQLTLLELAGREFGPTDHPVALEDFSKSAYLEKILQKVTYEQPSTYENLLRTKGVGPKTMRALALVSEVIYGAAPSYVDPARYSFAHGGKDATPFPVDEKTYDETIHVMQQVVQKSRLNVIEKDKAITRLQKRTSE